MQRSCSGSHTIENLKKAIKAEIPEVVVGTRDDSCVVSIVQKSGPNSINPIALCDVVLKQYHYKFASLQNPEFFNQVRVNGGAVSWPGDIDLAPDAMHEAIRKSGEWVLR